MLNSIQRLKSDRQYEESNNKKSISKDDLLYNIMKFRNIKIFSNLNLELKLKEGNTTLNIDESNMSDVYKNFYPSCADNEIFIIEKENILQIKLKIKKRENNKQK